MFSFEPLSDAALALAEELLVLVLDAEALLAAEEAADDEPPDEQPAMRPLPARAAPTKPVSLRALRLVYEWS